MSRSFNNWINEFKDSIADYKYYTEFDKVYKNISVIKEELKLINTLVGSNNIENDFIKLVEKHPEILRVVPILLAKRGNIIKVISQDGEKTFNFYKMSYTIKDYVEFMRETGIFDLLSNHLISDLYDYVVGIEVGLDSNARKNRTGTAMENIVESFIIDAGFIKGINYFKEMNKTKISQMFGIELNFDFLEDGKAEKRFDFVIKTEDKVYAIEVNFYSSSGSKLNETARSYKMLAEEAKKIEGFEFVWITDGVGWKTAKRNLEETFNEMKHIYNLKDLEQGIFKLFK